MKRGFDAIIIMYTKNLTALAGNRTQGLRIYVSVLWPLSYGDTAVVELMKNSVQTRDLKTNP